ncbi:collagen alpha-1(I) chain isoform X2 [Lepisosteus oculatus]|uniref:collagen alpha-1(I) chain isoform X2 n=1 Tax=Lepisosteus oculatus TaxID=7918 RepID=UPI0035F5177C
MQSPLSKGWGGGGGGRAQRYRPASEFDEATLAKKREYWRTKKREQRAKERSGPARPGTGDLPAAPAPSPPLAPGPPADEGLGAEWSCQMDPQGPTSDAAAGLCDVLVSPSFFDVLDLDELPDGEAPAPGPWGARLSASPVAAEPQLGGGLQGGGAWAGGPPDGPPPPLDPPAPPAPARARRPAAPQHKERWFQRLKLNKILPQFPRACLGPPDEQRKPALRLKFTRVPQRLGADCWDLQAAGPGRDRPPPEPRPNGAAAACPPGKGHPQAQDNGAPPCGAGLPRLRIPPDVADGVRVNAGARGAAPETEDERVARRREYWRLKKREQRAKVLARARESCWRPDTPPPPQPGPQPGQPGLQGSRKGRRVSGKAPRRPPASVPVKQEPAGPSARAGDALRLGGAGLLAEAAPGVGYAAAHFSRAPSPGARAALWRQKRAAGACQPAALGADPRGGPLALAAQQQLEEERMARRREYWRVKKREQRAKLSAEARARMKERDAHLRRVKRYQTILGEMRRGRLQPAGGRRPLEGLAAGDGELIGGFIKEDGTVTASIAPPPALFEAKHDVFNGQGCHAGPRFRPSAPPRPGPPGQAASPPGETRAALRGSPDRLPPAARRPLPDFHPPQETPAGAAGLGVTGPRPVPAPATTNEERMARKREYWRVKKREQRAKRAAQARRAFLPWRLDPARPPGRCASWVAVGPAAVAAAAAAAARAGRIAPRAGFLPARQAPKLKPPQARVKRERDRSSGTESAHVQTSPAEPQIKQQPPDEEPGPGEEGAAIEMSPAAPHGPHPKDEGRALTPESQRDGPSPAPRAPPAQVRDGAEPTPPPPPPPPPLPPAAGRPQRNRATNRLRSCCGPGPPGGPAPGRARPDLAEELRQRKRAYWRVMKQEQRARKAARDRELRRLREHAGGHAAGGLQGLGAFGTDRPAPPFPDTPGPFPAARLAGGPGDPGGRTPEDPEGLLPAGRQGVSRLKSADSTEELLALSVPGRETPNGTADPPLRGAPPSPPPLTPNAAEPDPDPPSPRSPGVQRWQERSPSGDEPSPPPAPSLPPPPPPPPSAGRPQRTRATAKRAESCCGPGPPGGPAPGRARPDLAEELRQRKRAYWRVKKQEQRARKAARDRELRRRGGAEPAGGWGPAESPPPGARGQTGEPSPQWLDCSDGEAQILHSGSPETSPRIGPDGGTTFRAKDRSAAGRPPEAHPGPPSPRPLSEGGGSGVPDSEAEWRALFLMDYDPLNQLLVCMVCGELQHSQSAEGARCHIEEAHPDSLGLSAQDRNRILAAWDEQVSLRERFFTSQLQQHQARPDETEDPPAEIEVLVDSDEAPASKDRRAASKNKSKNTDPQGRPRGAEDKRRRR